MSLRGDVITHGDVFTGSQLDMFGEAVPAAPQGIDVVLADRGSRYGDFDGHAQITQDIKDIMHRSPNWHRLTPAMKEALDMDAHKTGRILNGDPLYKDSWTDKIGYIRLVEKTL